MEDHVCTTIIGGVSNGYQGVIETASYCHDTWPNGQRTCHGNQNLRN